MSKMNPDKLPEAGEYSAAFTKIYNQRHAQWNRALASLAPAAMRRKFPSEQYRQAYAGDPRGLKSASKRWYNDEHRRRIELGKQELKNLESPGRPDAPSAQPTQAAAPDKTENADNLCPAQRRHLGQGAERLPYGTYCKATRHLYMRNYMRAYMRCRAAEKKAR